MNKFLERLKEIEDRKAELKGELTNEEKQPTEERVKEIATEAAGLSKEETEIRSQMDVTNMLKPNAVPEAKESKGLNSAREERANVLVKTGRTEMRALLSTGTIAKPTSVEGINGMAENESSIVDDVKAVALTGSGAYKVAYKKAKATSADVEDGKNVGGTGTDFGFVEINPAEWGTLDSISNQVKKMTSLDYLAEIEMSALGALRDKAETKIFAAITAESSLATRVYSIPLDQNYLRDIVLGFKPVKGKGMAKLYLSQTDLSTLGKIRGTNEKKALYDIVFDEGTNASGTIKEGGMAVPFRVTDELSAGTQVYGQPMTVTMPMWDQYEIKTDEGGSYFDTNMIGVRGVQTANAAVCAIGGMEIVSQSAKPGA